MAVTYAVLAAGDSKRMDFPKAITPLAGLSPLQRIAATLGERRFVIVTSSGLSSECAAQVPERRIVINEDPWRGMTSSLRSANGVIDARHAVGVLLADKPFLSERTLILCERALEFADCDVLYPVSNSGRPGHPVYFGPNARKLIEALPDGDTLRTLRDDPRLTHAAIACDDEGVQLDLDTPDQWYAAAALYHA